MKVEDYVGDKTIERMKQTKWYALARFLEELLYSGGTMHTEGSGGSPLGYDRVRKPKEGDPDYARKFVVSARLYTSGIAKGVKWDGLDGDHCDVQKTLRELAHECERMALKEVT